MRVGEFQELGVEVEARFQISETERDHLLDEWIAFVEQQGWNFGGGTNTTQLSGFVAKSRASLRPSDIDAIRGWLSHRFDEGTVRVGELRDAWHGW